MTLRITVNRMTVLILLILVVAGLFLFTRFQTEAELTAIEQRIGSTCMYSADEYICATWLGASLYTPEKYARIASCHRAYASDRDFARCLQDARIIP